MKLSLCAFGALATSASALNLAKRDSPSTLSVPFIRKRADEHYQNIRRSDGVDVKMDKHGRKQQYWANFTLGSPPVNLWAEMDTGSADLLVLTNNIPACGSDPKSCAGGVVSASKSSTWTWLKTATSGYFNSGETWKGTFATDKLTIGGTTLNDFQFIGLTEFSGTSAGIYSIFGIGFYSRENVPQGAQGASSYNNLVYALADAGTINTAAYSLYLEDADKGSFLFGAVDKSKYHEPLVTFNVARNNYAFRVANSRTQGRDKALVVLTGFGTTHDGKSSNLEFTP